MRFFKRPLALQVKKFFLGNNGPAAHLNSNCIKTLFSLLKFLLSTLSTTLNTSKKHMF
jgi:hypothetical protein